MTEFTQNCCKLLTSVEMFQGDTNENVLAEFPSSLRYCATNILTDGVDKTFCPFTFFSVRLISTENKVEEPLQFLSMVGGQGISFEDLNALRTTSLMKVATSFNLSREAARYDAATAFEIDISELKTSQNEMQPFHDTFENEINCEILSSFSIFYINFWERKCRLG